MLIGHLDVFFDEAPIQGLDLFFKIDFFLTDL